MHAFMQSCKRCQADCGRWYLTMERESPRLSLPFAFERLFIFGLSAPLPLPLHASFRGNVLCSISAPTETGATCTSKQRSHPCACTDGARSQVPRRLQPTRCPYVVAPPGNEAFHSPRPQSEHPLRRDNGRSKRQRQQEIFSRRRRQQKKTQIPPLQY